MVDVPDRHTFELYTDRLKENVRALSQEIEWLKKEKEELKRRIEAIEEIAGVKNDHKGV